ncbi:transposase [Chryseobacterium sp. MIQD13]|uniref:transposase n=1 Tax=Chryseobacterium sp. MIQD13 TaxID=3422310 RepID=UPI003D2AB335
MNLKSIHIGKLIYERVNELRMPVGRIEKFMKCSEEEIEQMYQESSIDTFFLLKWSKLLEYDFFRLYSGHLILYAPPARTHSISKGKDSLPAFRKHIYTEEVKNFILEKIANKEMTLNEVILKYRIPKTTLYTWIKKS